MPGSSPGMTGVIPGWSEGPDPESRDSGFDAEPVIGPRFARTRWHRPGMTAKPSLTRPGILDVEFSQGAGNDEIIVVEHQGPRDAVLEQFERHRINRRLLAVLGLGVAVVIAHRNRPSR